MNSQNSTWQTQYELTTCAAGEIDRVIPATVPGIAVIYSQADGVETIYLVLESRSGSLRDLCARRIETAKIPVGTALTVSFKSMEARDKTQEAIATLCREQVILAGELRRALRPAMR